MPNVAMGYSACFLSALNSIARGQKYKLPEDVEVHADVSIGVPEGSTGFSLAVELVVKGSFPDSDKTTVEKLVHEAHQMCPYSRATYVIFPSSHTAATTFRCRCRWPKRTVVGKFRSTHLHCHVPSTLLRVRSPHPACSCCIRYRQSSATQLRFS